ncbi:MAG: hypothetical protein IT190_02745 [Microbacteriaceae bacterium]|nr:hypothetical protein [Microbacteriaceae bacterium]
MTARITVGAFHAAVHVEAVGLRDDEAQSLRNAWARCRPTPGSRSVELLADIGGATPDAVALGHQLSTRITLALIELVRDELLLLHACAIAHQNTGAVMALIGPSGRGKTTAAINLGRHFGYVTDETVAVRADRSVLPYPKPLSVVQRGSPVKVQLGPDELGLLDVTGVTPLRLEAIALLDRRSDAPPEPALSTVGLVDAIDDIVPQISYLSARPRPLLQLANLIAEVGGIRRLSYRDSTQLPDLVENVLGNREDMVRTTTESWSAARMGSTAVRGIRRAAVVDAIDDGHHVIVLKDDMVRVLGGIATHIWRAADGVSIEDLTGILVAELGVPPEDDAAVLIDAAVDELQAAGLLVSDDGTKGGGGAR